MNRFFKHEKAVTALLLVCAMILFIALPVCAETIGEAASNIAATSGEGSEAPPTDAAPQSLWADPMFYVFLAMVAGFLALVAVLTYVYLKARHIIKERKYSSYEQTIKIYDDLDEHLWDAPDTVMIDAEPPPAAYLDDLVPVETIRGLNHYTIEETPIDPVQAIRMGAEPYAPYQNVTNTVFESVEGIQITPEELVAPPTIAPEALENTTSGYQHLYAPPAEPVSAPNAFVYQNDISYASLEDPMVTVQPTSVENPAVAPYPPLLSLSPFPVNTQFVATPFAIPPPIP